MPGWAADSALQLIAVLRFWNVIECCYPYRNFIGGWSSVLSEFTRARPSLYPLWSTTALAARMPEGTCMALIM